VHEGSGRICNRSLASRFRFCFLGSRRHRPVAKEVPITKSMNVFSCGIKTFCVFLVSVSYPVGS
jgi:hypothetical protein